MLPSRCGVLMLKLQALPVRACGDVLGAQGIGLVAQHFTDGVAVELLGRQAVPVQVGGVVQAKALLAVDVADQDRHGVDDQLQLGLALAQGLLGVLALGQVQGGAEEADRPAVVILVATAAGKHPAQLAIGLQQAVFLGVFGAVGDAVLDAAGDHGAVFGVHAVQVFADRQLAGQGRVDAVQLGEMGVGDEAVLADVPVPGADRVGGGEGQLQAFFGVVLGLEAGGGALFQFEGDAPAFVGFDGGDQDPGDLGVFIADRAVGQVEPEVGIATVALQGEALFAVGAHLALQDGAVNRVGKVFKFWPDQVRRLSESVRVLAAGQQGEAIVVDLRQLRAPEQQHRHRRVNHDVHGGAQALRPGAGSAQRAVVPSPVWQSGPGHRCRWVMRSSRCPAA